MRIVAASRDGWTAVRRRLAAFAGSAKSGSTSARLMPVVASALAAAMLGCAALGYGMVQRDDDRLAVERRAALELVLDQFGSGFNNVSQFDEAQLRLLERRAGLKDLRFETEPATSATREVQSLHDRNGRILGWLTWAPDRGLTRAMSALWAVAAAIAGAFAIVALLSMLYARRLAAALTRSERTVHKLTSEDALMGLPTQRVVLDRLRHTLALRGSRYVAFAVADLDGFREVNDTLGRDGGDNMLAKIAERLTATLPPGALCGRYEDDAFAFVLPGDEPDTAARLAEALRTAFARPIFMNQMWQIGASVGLAQAPGDGTSAEDLTRRAGLALRAAKRKGRGLALHFEAAIETEHYDRRFLLRELKAALAAQAFEVHYQPVVAADGSGVLGVEALLRWTHPLRGAIAPSVFIPLAEQIGLMPAIGAFVLRRALADAARWPNLFIAVNLSPVQMRDRHLVDLVAAIMAENAIASSRVVLEVTEGVLIDDPDEAKLRLEALRALGVHIALDDFGAGYSSLNYLRQFPFDRLKIDRAFVAALGRSGNAAAIVQSVVTLGHALGMSVLAEGVETDEQRVLLRLAGCDEMQGYLFARPAPADEIDALLAAPAVAPPRRKVAAGH